ncbi:MAG TPA: UDP-3-O-acyl-N-acetylglucosamine deacetylase [Chlamydiales bacterium]|jgi:UDP-3-O-[3-hydroxymyristoyl] N-acetylglucosamine deacetylase
MREILADSVPLQTTLKGPVFYAGLGLFTGAQCAIRLVPSTVHRGIVFRRVDLPGKPEVPARLEFVVQAIRSTRLLKGDASVQTVEHLLSALQGLGVDNVDVEVQGPEVPMSDGSAKEFVRMIEEAGIQTLDAPRKIIRIEQPIYWSEGNVHLIALPAPASRFSYTLHYPHSPLIRSQYHSCLLNGSLYKADIAECRTFTLYEEIAPMIEQGLLKGGGLENGLVIQGNLVLNPGGLRFSDEPARHKILDLIGDLALLGAPIEGHVIAVCSGHASNTAFAREIQKRRGI